MEPACAQRTVLEYVKLDFLGEWEYDRQTCSFRPARQEGELRVLREAAPGLLETQWFVVRRRDFRDGHARSADAVIKPFETNFVSIPERCVRKERGDHTSYSTPRRTRVDDRRRG